MVFEKKAEKLPGRRRVPSFLNEQVQNLAFVIDRAPEPHALARDANDHFVQMPPTSGSLSLAAKIGAVQRAELDDPEPDGFTADFDPTFGEKILDVTKAERETKIEPHGMTDDCGRKTMTLLGDGHR